MPRSKTATRRSAMPRFHRSAPGRAASSRSAKIPILCMSALCRGCLFFHHSLSAFTILSRYFVARNNRLIICLDNFKVNLRSPIVLFDFRSSHRNEGKRKTAGKTGRRLSFIIFLLAQLHAADFPGCRLRQFRNEFHGPRIFIRGGQFLDVLLQFLHQFI